MATYNQLAGQKIQRMEAISDGVFAIAITLLVLDIKVPLNDSVRSEAALVDIFLSLAPKLLSYFLSFMTLGILWTGHTAQYNYIEKSDRNLNWISLFFLLFISILPITTAFLSEYIEFKFAIGLYWANILALGILLYLHWTYAEKHHFLTHAADQSKDISKAIIRRIITSQSMYAIGALLCFIDTYLSILVIVAIQLNYAFAFFSPRKK